MDAGALKWIATVLSIAHDLICAGLLFVIVILQIRMHEENKYKLRHLDEHLNDLTRNGRRKVLHRGN